MSVSARHATLPGLKRQRYGLADALLAAAMVATFFFADLYLALAASVLIMIVFALSLDLAQGYAGIETLGHAAFFGSGAYAAGLYALHVSPEPLSGLVVGALAAALFGALSGMAVVRTQGLTQIMLTLVSATLLFELANVAKRITMGDDGLTGYTVAPLLGPSSSTSTGAPPICTPPPCCLWSTLWPSSSSTRRSASWRRACATTRCACGCSACRSRGGCLRSTRCRPHWPAWPARCRLR